MPPPATARVWVPVVFQYQMPVSLLTTAPLARVMPLLTYRPPLTVRLGLLALPSVTPLSVGLLVAVSARPLPLMMVPPVMVPLTEFSPPVLKTPPSSMSSVLLALLRMPVILTRPPVRTKLPSTGVVRLPPRLSVPPERLKPPVLLALVPDRFMMPPETLSVPALLQVVELSVVVPALVENVAPAALLKLVTWMVEVVAGVLCSSVPRLITLAAELS